MGSARLRTHSSISDSQSKVDKGRHYLDKQLVDYPISDSNSFSPLRFVRFLQEQGGAGNRALENESIVGGELIYESEEAFRDGNFALRSEGCVIFFTANSPLPLNESLKFGDKIEVRVSSAAKVSLESHIHVSGQMSARLLVRPMRELKSNQFNFETAKRWHDYIRAVRDFFNERGFLETLTPSLVTNPGMEPELEPFATEFRNGRQRQRLFLPTSPELHLKQILAAGFTEVFEIKSCFRNEEVTEHHQPEFQMLEWYRAYATLKSIEKDLVELVQTVAKNKNLKVERASIAELFEKYFSFKLTPETSREELIELAKAQKIETTPDDSWNDIFHRLFVSKIELQLGIKAPVVIFNFPPSQAALARLTADGWADRFELFWNGLEIANAFHELNDPKEQLKRFEADQKRRIERGRTPLEIDQNFMQALEAGLPPSAGIALGLDRLFMGVFGIREITKARFFGVGHQT